MTFALTPAAPFTASVSTITAATANDWRTYISQSLDTVNGGAYVNVTSIDWSAGGAGWRFYAALAIKSTGSLTLDTGATVTLAADATVSSGGGWDFEGGSLCRFRGTAGGATLQVDDNAIVSCAGDVTWTGTSTQTHASSSTDTYQSGSTLSLGGNSTWASTSVCVHASSSTDTYQIGSSLTTNSGALINLTIGSGAAGSLALGASSTLTVTAGASVTMSVGGGGTPGTLTINADGTLTTSASSIFNQGGTTTRTGKEVLSGNGAYTAMRIVVAADPPTNTDPRQFDMLIVEFLAADEDLDFDTLGASDTVVFYIRYEALSKNLQVKYGGLPLYLFTPTPGSQRTVQFFWNGSTYKVGIVGALTAI